MVGGPGAIAGRQRAVAVRDRLVHDGQRLRNAEVIVERGREWRRERPRPRAAILASWRDSAAKPVAGVLAVALLAAGRCGGLGQRLAGVLDRRPVMRLAKVVP